MDAFNDYYEKIISTTEIIKQPIQDTFKLPIQYNKHKTLDNSLLEDIELCGNNNKYNCILNNKENFNLLIDDYSKYYSTSKSFLKDTQKLCNNFNIEDFDCSECEVENTRCKGMYEEFLQETSFDDKYQYLTFNMLRKFNKNPLVLQCLGYYNLSTPVLSLATPIFILIIPYFVLRFKGIRITMRTYVSMMKTILFRSSIFRGLMNFSNGTSSEKISFIVSLIFYGFQIYNNVISCISFYNNLNNMYSFIQSYKKYLKYTLNNMNEIQKNIVTLKSYHIFNTDIESNKVVLKKMLNKVNCVFEFDNLLSKLTQMGVLLKINYELFYDVEHLTSFYYSIKLNQYVHDLKKINNLIKNKKLNKRSFVDKKIMKGMYYMPHINDDKYTTNDIDIKKNIVVTGPNASGKTTLIKSILINLIISQQWGYGCFEKCKMSIYDNFHSYLNIPDTSNRDSLFQAEARRCKDIIEKIHSVNNKREKERNFCIFDEIYSGTNPIDATLCATAYLKAMNTLKKSCDYVLTTHYTELCKNINDEEFTVNKKMNTIINKNEDGKTTYEYTYKLIDGISKINGGKQILIDLDYPQYVLDFV